MRDAHHTMYALSSAVFALMWALALLAGVALACWGTVRFRRVAPSERAMRAWRRRLESQGLLGGTTSDREVADIPMVTTDMALHLEHILARQEVGAGVGLALAALAFGAYSFATTGEVVSALFPSPFALWGLLWLGGFIGAAVAGAFSETEDTPAFAADRGVGTSPPAASAPLRRTRLALLPAALLIADVALVFILAPRILVPTPQTGQYPPDARLPPWMIQACALLLLVLFGAAEWTYRRAWQLWAAVSSAGVGPARRGVTVVRASQAWSVYVSAYSVIGLVALALGMAFLIFARRDFPSDWDVGAFLTLVALNLLLGPACYGVVWARGWRRPRLPRAAS